MEPEEMNFQRERSNRVVGQVWRVVLREVGGRIGAQETAEHFVVADGIEDACEVAKLHDQHSLHFVSGKRVVEAKQLGSAIHSDRVRRRIQDQEEVPT